MTNNKMLEPADRIGFMQGRLSPMVNGQIQAFPWNHWKEEFVLAEKHGFSFMEWTLDSDRFHENPLLTPDGRDEIIRLKHKHGVSIPSLTGDCFMQTPFFKASGNERKRLLADLAVLIRACAGTGITQILIPLVDGGRLENSIQEERLFKGLEEMVPLLRRYDIAISFESDLPPDLLARFISAWEPEIFGITYDIGNSAALGFNTYDEIDAYGDRIINVHIKDRTLHGSTVPLGAGNADIPLALNLIRRRGYKGNFILQTARARNEDHATILCRYREMVRAILIKEAIS